MSTHSKKPQLIYSCKVFGEKALQAISSLSTKEGDGQLRPEMIPMKPWPKEERNKILKGILGLHYLSDEHREEWRQWFGSMAEVNYDQMIVCKR